MGGNLCDSVVNLDDRASYDQWLALFQIDTHQPGPARETFDGSVVYRSTSPKRLITRHFPEGHLLCAEGRHGEGLEMLARGIQLAMSHDLYRYVTSGTALRHHLELKL